MFTSTIYQFLDEKELSHFLSGNRLCLEGNFNNFIEEVIGLSRYAHAAYWILFLFFTWFQLNGK